MRTIRQSMALIVLTTCRTAVSGGRGMARALQGAAARTLRLGLSLDGFMPTGAGRRHGGHPCAGLFV